jgi:hypothetical protein
MSASEVGPNAEGIRGTDVAENSKVQASASAHLRPTRHTQNARDDLDAGAGAGREF